MLKQTERILKAISDKNRIRILNMLSVKPMCVCEITNVLSLSQSTVSGHLRILKEVEVIEDIKDGLWIEYSIKKDNKFISEILNSMFESLSHDEEMEKERIKAKVTDRNIICKK